MTSREIDSQVTVLSMTWGKGTDHLLLAVQEGVSEFF